VAGSGPVGGGGPLSQAFSREPDPVGAAHGGDVLLATDSVGGDARLGGGDSHAIGKNFASRVVRTRRHRRRYPPMRLRSRHPITEGCSVRSRESESDMEDRRRAAPAVSIS